MVTGVVVEDVLGVYGQPTTKSQKVGEVHSGERLEITELMVREGLTWWKTTIADGLLRGWVASGPAGDPEQWIKFEVMT